jgi:diaminopimelate epimerase
MMKFTKMHGIGNDFVMVEAFHPKDAPLLVEAKERSVFLCDRKFGVGADGVIVVLPSKEAQFEMRMFNPDGSEAEMCGNGIRCFAKYVYDNDLSQDSTLSIKTGAGILATDATVVDGRVASVKVDMGKAVLDRALIPVDLGDGGCGPVVSQSLRVLGQEYNITTVSMGNPHCVVFVDDVANIPLTVLGPSFEKHKAFPKRINTEFVQILSKSEVRMRVWERGAAETLACGTGACATAVASALNQHTGRDVLVHLAGGDLQISWKMDGRVEMTGPAETVFQGEI